jgi:hypothetical protein
MYSPDEFESLEIMCRERAMHAKRAMENRLAEVEYWLAEAQQWKRLRESPLIERNANRSNDLARSNTEKVE